MPAAKPKLPQLQTPVSSTFPSELSALSARSPIASFVDIIKQEEGIKTPITPPTAYTDFLKAVASPLSGDKLIFDKSITSAPSTSSSEHSSCSCSRESTHKSPTSTVPPSPFVYPASAPSTARLARLRIPPSPAVSASDSPRSATPRSATSSAIRSPFSARSPYEWDLGKTRYFEIKSPKSTRSGVRHVREIVTRTVTYTPRMKPAPKGKRRKLDQIN